MNPFFKPLELPSSLELTPAACFIKVNVSKSQIAQDNTPPSSIYEIPESLTSAAITRKWEFALGRFCAQEALKQLNHPSPSIGLDPKTSAPIWPTNIRGSISHKWPYVAAVATNEPREWVGVDIEQIVDLRRMQKISRKIISQNEWAEVQKQTPFPPEITFTLIFSAKESLYKCLYPKVQQFFGFEAAQVIHIDSMSFQIELTQDLSPFYNAGTTFLGHFDFVEDCVVTSLLHNSRDD